MDLTNFIEVAKTLNVLGIKVTQNNELTAEWHSEGECRRNIYSAAKSFTSCAVGFAVPGGADFPQRKTDGGIPGRSSG